jgi:acetyl esterase/lipase
VKTRLLLWLAMGTASATLSAQPPAVPPISAPGIATPATTPKIPNSVEVVRDVEYCTGGGHPLLLDLYAPRSPSGRLAPAVLLIHGGGWRIGSKEGSALAVNLASKGFVAASANYRLSGEAPFPAAIEDVKCAVRYLRANAAKYGIDPKRIGVVGSSAGGHLALLVATAHESAGLEGSGGWDGVSSRVSAVVSWFGPADFSVGPTAFERGKGPSIIAFLGGTPEQRPQNYKTASPVTWVSEDDPPLLMLHGSEDTTVPFDQSVRMEKAYRKAGLDVELVKVENAGHNFTPVGNKPISPTMPEIMEKSVAFLRKHLGSDNSK